MEYRQAKRDELIVGESFVYQKHAPGHYSPGYKTVILEGWINYSTRGCNGNKIVYIVSTGGSVFLAMPEQLVVES